MVLAELEYLLLDRYGVDAELGLLADVAAGAYRLEAFASSDVQAAIEVIERYSDAAIGLADASVVVLSGRHHCTDVLTLDEGHFRSLRGYRGKPFRLLPADSV